MTRLMLALAFPLLFPAALPAQTRVTTPTPPQRPGWRLVWHDEFDGSALDASKWNVLLREQSKHNELQYYLPDEVWVEKGMLHIRSERRTYGSQQYTSGRLDTSGKFAPVYGRFEIRGRLPRGRGLWPA